MDMNEKLSFACAYCFLRVNTFIINKLRGVCRNYAAATFLRRPFRRPGQLKFRGICIIILLLIKTLHKA